MKSLFNDFFKKENLYVEYDFDYHNMMEFAKYLRKHGARVKTKLSEQPDICILDSRILEYIHRLSSKSRVEIDKICSELVHLPGNKFSSKMKKLNQMFKILKRLKSFPDVKVVRKEKFKEWMTEYVVPFTPPFHAQKGVEIEAKPEKLTFSVVPINSSTAPPHK